MRKTVRQARLEDVTVIRNLLNKYLSYGLADEQNTTDKVMNQTTYVCLKDEQIIGIIISKDLELGDFTLEDNEWDILDINQPSKYISHIVVDENYRGYGVATNLLNKLMSDMENQYNVFAVGWIKSDNNKWEAETVFKHEGFSDLLTIPNYFEREGDVYCPCCKGNCRCSAKIVFKNCKE